MNVKVKYLGPKSKISIPLPFGSKSKGQIRWVTADPHCEIPEKDAVKLLAWDEEQEDKHGTKQWELVGSEKASQEEADQMVESGDAVIPPEAIVEKKPKPKKPKSEKSEKSKKKSKVEDTVG